MTQAVALADQRRIAEARIAIARAISLRDDEPSYYLVKGRIELAANAPAGAFNAFQSAMDLDATNREALLGVAQLGLQLGQITAATKAADRLLTLNPNEAQALAIKGLLALVKRRYDEAIGFAERLITNDPDGETGSILYARALFMKGERAAALARADELSRKFPASIGAARTQLELGRAAGDPRRMEAAFEILREQDQQDPDLKIDEANLLYKLGQNAKATALISQVLASRAVDRAHAVAAIAVSREFGMTDPDAAMVNAVAAEGSVNARTELGHFLVENGKFAKAETLISSVSGADSRALVSMLTLARGQSDSALTQADSILRDDADNCLALTVRAGALLQSGKPVAAIPPGQLAAAECPQSVDAWQTTALAFAASGDPTNARRVFRDGISANPQEPRMTSAYTDWLLRSGNTREALAAVRMLTNRTPSLIGGWVLYENVCDRAAAGCGAEARAGLAKAKVAYQVDLAPGESPPAGLFARIEPD